MRNIMDIDGFQAKVEYDPEINMFRGEFINITGLVDFYGETISGLMNEGRASLKVFLDMCKEDGANPRKSFSGKFSLRIPPDLHGMIATKAASSNTSISAWVIDALKEKVHHE